MIRFLMGKLEDVKRIDVTITFHPHRSLINRVDIEWVDDYERVDDTLVIKKAGKTITYNLSDIESFDVSVNPL